MIEKMRERLSLCLALALAMCLTALQFIGHNVIWPIWEFILAPLGKYVLLPFWQRILKPIPFRDGLMAVLALAFCSVMLLVAMSGLAASTSRAAMQVLKMPVQELIATEHLRQDIQCIKRGDLVIMPSGQPWMAMVDADKARNLILRQYGFDAGSQSDFLPSELVRKSVAVVHRADPRWVLLAAINLELEDPRPTQPLEHVALGSRSP